MIINNDRGQPSAAQRSSNAQLQSPAIVIVGYNRPDSLKRLLKSVSDAIYPADRRIPLIISLDYSGSNACETIASSTDWEHGDLELIFHTKNLGLRQHILVCGDLSIEYGSVIILEDDLTVAPYFYQYTLSALASYSSDSNIAGLSLYAYDVVDQSRRRFIPIDDGYDNYFLQMAVSSGQVWTQSQWITFREWYDQRHHEGVLPQHAVPAQICVWPESSWKKYFIRYLVESNRFFVCPRSALTTNFGDPGTHDNRANWHQVPLLMGVRHYRWSTLEESLAVYDAFFELLPRCLKRLNPALSDFDFECDLYGSKDPRYTSSPNLISCRPCAKPQLTFGLRMIPEVMNPALNIEGDFFSLGNKYTFAPPSFKKNLIATAHVHKVSQQQLLAGGMIARIYNTAKDWGHRITHFRVAK